MSNETTKNFLGLEGEQAAYETARVAVLPIPYEATVSYGGGTARGPSAIIEASSQVELYDEELGCEPCDVGIATLPPLSVDGIEPTQLMERVQSAVGRVVADGKFPLVLGGEHSITPAAVRAVQSAHEDITVVQLDAHADLREEYEGQRYNHACTMARVREICPAVQVGIRSLSTEEALRIEKEGLPIFFARDLRSDSGWITKAVSAIKSKKVYVTIDVDVFDASFLPATGTPEPGGLDWYQVTSFLQALFSEKRVVGVDLVELSPIDEFRAYDFIAAKLAYKCIGYWRDFILRGA